jgi:hypothetical protein
VSLGEEVNVSLHISAQLLLLDQLNTSPLQLLVNLQTFHKNPINLTFVLSVKNGITSNAYRQRQLKSKLKLDESKDNWLGQT